MVHGGIQDLEEKGSSGRLLRSDILICWAGRLVGYIRGVSIFCLLLKATGHSICGSFIYWVHIAVHSQQLLVTCLFICCSWAFDFAIENAGGEIVISCSCGSFQNIGIGIVMAWPWSWSWSYLTLLSSLQLLCACLELSFEC